MTSASPRFPMLKRHARWPIPVLLLLSIPVFYYNLGNYGLVNGDEGFYHLAARNMVTSGDWLTLQWDGELRVYETFLNSPMQHWARAIIITIGGDNYWTMRLLSATCGMLAVIFTYRLARQFMTSAEAFLAAILLMVSFHFVFLHGARTGELDAIITLIFVWLAYSFVKALREDRSLIPHHLGLIALISVKLPVIIIPVLFEAAYLAIMPRYRKHAKRWVLHLLWMAPLGMTWHVYQIYELGWETSVTVFNLMSDQAGGQAGQAAAREHQTLLSNMIGRVVYYGPILLFGGLPYIIFAPLALFGVWRHKASRRTREYLTIITLVPVVMLVFYCTIARRMPWYVIPVYPFFSILVARFLFRFERLGRSYLFTGLFGLASALGMALYFLPRVVNPFSARALIITPALQIANPGHLEWWIYLPALASGICVTVLVLRRVSRRLPIHLVSTLCILLVVGFGGIRIATALQYTDHVSPLERFANDLAAKVARGDKIQYPLNCPVTKGRWSGRMVYRHFFGEQYEISTYGKRTQLVRPLMPRERPTLRREDLKLSVTPGGNKKGDSSVPGRALGQKGRKQRRT